MTETKTKRNLRGEKWPRAVMARWENYYYSIEGQRAALLAGVARQRALSSQFASGGRHTDYLCIVLEFAEIKQNASSFRMVSFLNGMELSPR